MPEQLHAEIIEQLPSYALGCLDPAEAAAVATHLAGCAACRAELAAYQGLTGRLAQAAPPVAPPPALKSRLLQRVQSPAHARRAPRVPGAEQGLLRRVPPVWAIVSLLLVAGLAVGNLVLWQQLNRAPAPTTGMRTIVLAGTAVAPKGTATW
ncbi:MAG: zf-HC2 domain-containing protein [Chloroflexota bacterium]